MCTAVLTDHTDIDENAERAERDGFCIAEGSESFFGDSNEPALEPLDRGLSLGETTLL